MWITIDIRHALIELTKQSFVCMLKLNDGDNHILLSQATAFLTKIYLQKYFPLVYNLSFLCFKSGQFLEKYNTIMILHCRYEQTWWAIDKYAICNTYAEGIKIVECLIV